MCESLPSCTLLIVVLKKKFNQMISKQCKHSTYFWCLLGAKQFKQWEPYIFLKPHFRVIVLDPSTVRGLIEWKLATLCVTPVQLDARIAAKWGKIVGGDPLSGPFFVCLITVDCGHLLWLDEWFTQTHVFCFCVPFCLTELFLLKLISAFSFFDLGLQWRLLLCTKWNKATTNLSSK